MVSDKIRVLFIREDQDKIKADVRLGGPAEATGARPLDPRARLRRRSWPAAGLLGMVGSAAESLAARSTLVLSWLASFLFFF